MREKGVFTIATIQWSSPDPNLEVLHVTSSDDSIHLTIKSITTASCCPTCSKPSSRIHSRYTRKISDLPICDQSVKLLLISRRWFCDQIDCETKIFTERFDWISSSGRRTRRTEEFLRKIAFSTSCLSAEKVAKAAHIHVSHDTLLNIIRRTNIDSEVSPFRRSR